MWFEEFFTLFLTLIKLVKIARHQSKRKQKKNRLDYRDNFEQTLPNFQIITNQNIDFKTELLRIRTVLPSMNKNMK